jgi:hypothetical protein
MATVGVEQPCYTLINVPSDAEPPNEMQLRMDLGIYIYYNQYFAPLRKTVYSHGAVKNYICSDYMGKNTCKNTCKNQEPVVTYLSSSF